MKLSKILTAIESFAPLSLQESYDNSGLIVGNPEQHIAKAIISFDVTEEVIEEAIINGVNLIISHHPVIFSGIKKLNGKNYVERIVLKAIKNDIALYAVHTNLDNIIGGTNRILAEKLGLKNLKVLQNQSDNLRKLVVFVPKDYLQNVQDAIFVSGAGHIGKYDQCSFQQNGIGTFRALEGATPFVGELNKLHKEEEVRLETIFPVHLQSAVILEMITAHPYEEVAYDIYPISNKSESVGAGIIATLEKEEDEMAFLMRLKDITSAKCIRYTKLRNKPIRKVALCGGSGAFLINTAKSAGADVYITGDVKYHEFFDSENEMLIADVGHYESEQFTIELLFDFIKENFPTFAVQISDINTNPINYL
jgi:dinuclear metal center YbgI/SA1388 family protein